MNRIKRLHARSRFETAWAKNRLGDLLDRVRHPDVTYSGIDVARVNALLPLARREAVARAIADTLAETDKPHFFRHLGRYGRRFRDLPRGIPVLDDIYAPNLAVLDFLTRHVADLEREVLLDLPCGIGNLLCYERALGFANVYGYDDWSQLARSTAGRFLSRFGIDDSVLLDAQALASIPATILTCIGVPWQVPDRLALGLALPSVRYALLDRLERPETLPGFERVGEYPGLITIFRRTTTRGSD